MENDENKDKDEVIDETKGKPEEKVRGSLLTALDVISPDAAAEFKDKPDEPKDDTLPVEDEPKPDDTTVDVLPDDIVDDKPVVTDDPEPIKISAKDIRMKRKVKQSVEPVKAAPTPEPEPEKPKPEPEAPDLSHLSKRERDTIALVQFGEENGNANKGVADKVLKYYENRQAIIEKLQSDNDDDDSYDITQDRELSKWKKRNPPPIDADSLDDIRQERTVKIATDRAVDLMKEKTDKTQKEFDDYKRGVEVDKLRPAVDAKVSAFSDGVLQGMPEEVNAVISKEGDWSKVEEVLPVEAPIVQRVLSKYADQAESFLSVVNGVAARDATDPLQNEVREFMFKQADILISKGKTLRSGKEFIHPARFKGEEGTWTFSTDHVLQMLTKAAQNEAGREIISEQKRIDAIISRRSARAEAPKGDEDKAPASTSVKSSPAGDSSTTKPVAGKSLAGLFDLN